MYDRPGTVKSLAASSKFKPSLHRIGSGRFLPHMTEAGIRVGLVRIQIDPSPLCDENKITSSLKDFPQTLKYWKYDFKASNSYLSDSTLFLNSILFNKLHIYFLCYHSWKIVLQNTTVFSKDIIYKITFNSNPKILYI